MPDFAPIGAQNQATTAGSVGDLRRQKAKQPVDRRGIPLPIRKSGYDALDKNSFLKLLVTQLSKQDPTNPMNDREFISQMAQFSSLEQMNNVANSMNKLRASQANQLIGKMINGKDFVTEKPVQGIATKATYDHNGEVFLSVGGRMVKLDDVTEVTEVTPIAPPIPHAAPMGNVSRETMPPGVTLGPPKQDPGAPVRQAHRDAMTPSTGQSVQVAPAQAAQAYETNQKAVNVSPETPPAAIKRSLSAVEATETEATIKKEIPKGE